MIELDYIRSEICHGHKIQITDKVQDEIITRMGGACSAYGGVERSVQGFGGET